MVPSDSQCAADRGINVAKQRLRNRIWKLWVGFWSVITFRWLFRWLRDQFAPRQRNVYPRRSRAVEPEDETSPTTASKTRRPTSVAATPMLVVDHASQVPRPWEDGGVPDFSDPEEVRPALMGALFDEVDQAEHQVDQDFLRRLIRLLGTDQLDLPPFPDVAWQLDTLLRLSDPPLVKVVKLVRREAALVRRVWTQACSAYYARPPNSLDHAVARIGFDALWRIGMSTCLYSSVFRVRGFQEHADAVRRHGIVTADVAAWISGEKLGPVYIAGLLHDVGKLLVYRAATSPKRGQLPSTKFVERIAREHHGSIGVLVAFDWKLGSEVSGGIGFHHDPDKAPEEHTRIARQIQVANIATHTAELSRKGTDCGGLLTLLNVEGIQFDVGRTIGKAHEILESLDLQPDAATQPALTVV